MAILAFLSVVVGFMLAGAIGTWLAPVTGSRKPELAVSSLVMEAASLALVIIGATIAYLQYRRDVPLVCPQHVSPLDSCRSPRPLATPSTKRSSCARPVADSLTVFFDNREIDGLVNGIAAAPGGLSGRMRRIQTGFASLPTPCPCWEARSL